jgi:hypothetical protein
LQSCEALHEVVQTWLLLSQAESIAQSPGAPQPQAPPPVTVRHTEPAGLSAHDEQAPPPLPQAGCEVPVTQLPPSQQPPLHSCDGLQLVVQVLVERSQARPAGQSAGPLQPHFEARQRWPLLEMVQSAHNPAAAPQALLPVPAAHTPLEQQAPLHGWAALQPVVQTWLVLSQAAPDEQSPGLLQPHAPPPATVTQAEPTPFPEQLWHDPPVAPQAPCAVPRTQMPPWQQPPLQGSVGLHEVEQLLVVRLQAFPLGQSLATLQPQPPPMQAEPAELPAQLKQALPVAPQVGVEVPLLQVEPGDEQQPPLQGEDPLQVAVQLWLALSQAWTPLQSPAVLQPQVPPPATVRHTPPAALEAQLVQLEPLAPQLACVVPTAQVPLWQQPPWQGWVLLHTLVHWCMVVLQAMLVGQSAGPLQPQLVPIQRWPTALIVQSTQAAPAGPQAEWAEPVAQVP